VRKSAWLLVSFSSMGLAQQMYSFSTCSVLLPSSTVMLWLP
jgi:hypothetical protein